MTRSKLLSILLLSFLIILASSCIPPRCKIPNCAVIIDHNHPRYGQTVKNNESGYQVYRGVPWYRYIFRKKYRAKSAKGRYRRIDTREAYDKN